ncbi:hypothetical protein [Laribacter hongkongensis]|uniref:hypothetical protein n=1 Tax=Laribacter hongkongensis TaxID=168471 RepID=UPI001EFDF8D4|nr:hypothetical protein [Laribacter hongkongensis]MCG9094453.1 hypothetical protein [Laribacter hongkongensis]
MQIIVNKPFDYAPDGIHVQHYPVGEAEIDDAGSEIAVREGWAKPVAGKSGAGRKSGTGRAGQQATDEAAPDPDKSE